MTYISTERNGEICGTVPPKSRYRPQNNMRQCGKVVGSREVRKLVGAIVAIAIRVAKAELLYKKASALQARCMFGTGGAWSLSWVWTVLLQNLLQKPGPDY